MLIFTWPQMVLFLIGGVMLMAAFYCANRSALAIRPTLMPARGRAPATSRGQVTTPAAPDTAVTLSSYSFPALTPREPVLQKVKTPLSDLRPGLLTKTEKVFFVR